MFFPYQIQKIKLTDSSPRIVLLKKIDASYIDPFRSRLIINSALIEPKDFCGYFSSPRECTIVKAEFIRYRLQKSVLYRGCAGWAPNYLIGSMFESKEDYEFAYSDYVSNLLLKNGQVYPSLIETHFFKEEIERINNLPDDFYNIKHAVLYLLDKIMYSKKWLFDCYGSEIIARNTAIIVCLRSFLDEVDKTLSFRITTAVIMRLFNKVMDIITGKSKKQFISDNVASEYRHFFETKKFYWAYTPINLGSLYIGSFVSLINKFHNEEGFQKLIKVMDNFNRKNNYNHDKYDHMEELLLTMSVALTFIDERENNIMISWEQFISLWRSRINNKLQALKEEMDSRFFYKPNDFEINDIIAYNDGSEKISLENILRRVSAKINTMPKNIVLHQLEF